MDWRDRKYYVASFSPEAYDMRMEILKSIEGVKLHPSTNHKINTKFSDEKELRGSYHVLIGCKADIKDIVEFELRKAERNDWWAKWKEVQVSGMKEKKGGKMSELLERRGFSTGIN